ncbi:MAG: 23S rRNA (guanosine-2'-O-)-methyltransferase RlmB [Eubacteriales bacterium SKADARSKE-1]|nr:23S rRNA (guanosine-2'-O-)-methyltransferase RlmB [Eubacteriales bacterium SKADARSKE-1]
MVVQLKSHENPIIKHVLKLINSKSFRKREKEFVIEGARLCENAVMSCVKIKNFFYTEKALERYKSTVELILKFAEKSYSVSEGIMESISDVKNSQGILCLCSMLDKQLCLDKISNVDKIVVFESIQDPSNLGTMLRTAEALGINEIILTQDCCDIYNPKVLRGSMGAVFRLLIHITCDLQALIHYFNDNEIKTYAAVPDNNSVIITNVDFNDGPCAVFIGNEGNGLKEKTINLCSKKLTIPMKGRAESLNAAVATSIIMWELIRGG